MKIIEKIADEYGARSPIQTWDAPSLPAGYLWCPEEFEAVFYSTTPAGFVVIEHDGETVTKMEVNEAALDAYLASLPPQKEPEPTEAEILDVLLGTVKGDSYYA